MGANLIWLKARKKKIRPSDFDSICHIVLASKNNNKKKLHKGAIFHIDPLLFTAAHHCWQDI